MLGNILSFRKKIFLLFLSSIVSIFVVIYIEFFLISQEQFTLEIKKGDNAYSISNKLYNENLISCKFCFLWINIFLSKGNLFFFKEGEYEFSNRRLSNFFSQIKNNKTKKYPLQITEGLTMKQIKKIIENAQFLSGEISQETLDKWEEGFFMPDTYLVEKNCNRNDFIIMAINNMKDFLNKVWQQKPTGYPLSNEIDVLKLASIVEAETPIAKERSHVAGVYINRLKNQMPLGADPVLVYYETNKEMCGQYILYFKHLRNDHEYNVYKKIGLPPTPICNPSKESILAAMHPDDTKDLYFVATGNGGHFFAQTFEEHKENIIKYKQNLSKK